MELYGLGKDGDLFQKTTADLLIVSPCAGTLLESKGRVEFLDRESTAGKISRY